MDAAEQIKLNMLPPSTALNPGMISGHYAMWPQPGPASRPGSAAYLASLNKIGLDAVIIDEGAQSLAVMIRPTKPILVGDVMRVTGAYQGLGYVSAALPVSESMADLLFKTTGALAGLDTGQHDAIADVIDGAKDVIGTAGDAVKGAGEAAGAAGSVLANLKWVILGLIVLALIGGAVYLVRNR